MQSVNTSELTGAALDWAVAKCIANVHEDALLNGVTMYGWWISGLFIDPNDWIRNDEFKPSTNWAHGGPIIEREKIAVVSLLEGWEAQFEPSDQRFSECHLCLQRGPTPLIAAMRCYVASKLGNTIEVPKELLNV